MPQLIYRVVSVCAALGYGFPKESLANAIDGRVDAIVADGGSMDAGPDYLATGSGYFSRDAVRADFRSMVEAGEQLACPVVVGNSGMAGGARNLAWMIDIAKDVFAELGVEAKVAVIPSDLDAQTVIAEFHRDALLPTGAGPVLDEDALHESTIVGQMGVHPLISALDQGAQYVIAGRACDVALFAADMIRRGIAPGLAYHASHILESGALACDPGSPSDCLVAEIYDDGSALFTAPNGDRRCTTYSIAAHSLYEEGHPQLQFYPEGILATEKTDFFSSGPRQAGIRNSHFVHAGKPWPWSIKLEGARCTAAGATEWTLHHLLQNEDLIQNRMFPITFYETSGASWTEGETIQPHYFDIGEKDYKGNTDERTLSLIADVPPTGPLTGTQALHDMTIGIHRRNTGVSRVTFDIFFSTGENYEAALRSNLFSSEAIAATLGLSFDHIAGTYFVDSCNAIKISVDRLDVGNAADQPDTFGAQLQSTINAMRIPLYASALARVSSF